MEKKILGKKSKIDYLPYIFISPAVILIVVFLLYPILNIFYYSVQNYNVTTPWANKFIGMENFIKIFTEDKLFYKSLNISAKWVFLQVTLQLFFGMCLGLLMNRKFKGRGVYRSMVFSPWAISGVLTSMIWALMYNQQIGVINDLLKRIGIIKSNVAWVANTTTVFKAVVVAELWRGIPFFAIMILAGLQNIPEELYEACRVDGGKVWHEFIYIKLPYLKDTIILTTLLRAVWEFNNVDLILMLTNGGPANRTTTLTMYLTQMAIRDSNFGYGSALAVVAFTILLISAVIYMKLSNYGKES